jgi:hypothetical protein
VLDLVRATQVPDWSAEREVFGADHAHVGAYLLGIWGLSDGIVEPVAFHHHPDDHLAAGFGAVTAVHVANALAEFPARPVDLASEVTGLDQTYLTRENLLPRFTRWRALCTEA